MSRTRLATLDPITRRDAASDFFAEENVPTHAITMGVATILEARKVVLIAQGEHKAGIIRETAEGPATPRVPATWLREHADASLWLDSAAAGKLTAVATPWVVGPVEWTDLMIKRAVLWLSEKTGKALLKLDNDDFRNHGLHQLLRNHGPAERVAHRVFRWMMDTINYHPAGKQTQRVICFSPHPDDDVISMGGTLIRLVEDQHEVHVAYMTSGNIAVFDHDARRVADLVTEYNRMFSVDTDKSHEIESTVSRSLGQKVAGQSDTPEVLAIKTLIRWSEAKAGAFVAGCKEENLHFLDLPFYRTGTIAKKPITEEDVRIIRELIGRLNPAQIYVAGDLSDPHGTHRVCAEAIFRALETIESGGPARGAALSRSVAGMGAARDRHRGAAQPARPGPQAGGDFPARIAKGFGSVSGSRRRPRILAAGRRAQPQHGDSLQPDRVTGILRARRLCPLERRADLTACGTHRCRWRNQRAASSEKYAGTANMAMHKIDLPAELGISPTGTIQVSVSIPAYRKNNGVAKLGQRQLRSKPSTRLPQAPAASSGVENGGIAVSILIT